MPDEYLVTNNAIKIIHKRWPPIFTTEEVIPINGIVSVVVKYGFFNLLKPLNIGHIYIQTKSSSMEKTIILPFVENPQNLADFIGNFEGDIDPDTEPTDEDLRKIDENLKNIEEEDLNLDDIL